ncbi:hypothetical protein LJC57_00885 [Parabacteroides sp. OttesenSCG-928-G07]|nr:hypothetical protein [Parabacteroides sp. OttesenSCG-928-G21]MDL2277124.1 hypothetical protein [Parabacteroides sp. OttesenSCG-928-G07]
MGIPMSTIIKLILSKLVALQSFFCERPRIDIDLVLNPDEMYGKRNRGLSHMQDVEEPIPISYAVYNYEFHWNYLIRIRNNSSKTAYNIHIEKASNSTLDYLEKLDDIISLKDGDVIELKYIIRYNASINGKQAEQIMNSFPSHLDRIEIIVSYTNESRIKFYTRFIVTKNSKTNEHLLRRPK